MNKTYRRFDPWRTAPVTEVSRNQIVQTYYFNVDEVHLQSPGSGEFQRYVLHDNTGDTIGVLATTDDGRIPLVEQYRLASHRWTLEIPAGHAKDPAERPLAVAQRKLQEEAGYQAGHLTQFARFINTPSFSTQHTTLFAASGLTPVDRVQIGPESPRSDVRLFTPQEAYGLVLNGTIVDAKTVIAILRLHGKLENKK